MAEAGGGAARRAPARRRPPLYGGDLAWIHHIAFGAFARGAAPGLLGLFSRAGIAGGVVVDLGCGSGDWLRELTRAGYRAVGVDPSPAFIRLARRKAPRAQLHVARAERFELPACDAVTAIGEVLSYRGPGGARRPGLPRLFRRLSQALRPGGLLVLDLLMASRGRPMRYTLARGGRTWKLEVEVSEDPRRGRVVRDIVTWRRAGGRLRRRREIHVLDVARREEVERALQAAGFSVRASRRYGAFELPARRLAFIAVKC